MKTLKIYNLFVIFVALACSCLLCGCQNNYEFINVKQDNELTGGNLTFDYQQDTQTINVGGNNEIILFYQTNLLKGWEEEGNRIGLEFNSPSNLKSFEDISIKIDEQEIDNINFLSVNNEKTGSFVIYPLIEKIGELIKITISWESNSKEQIYYLKIDPNTILMKK